MAEEVEKLSEEAEVAEKGHHGSHTHWGDGTYLYSTY